MAVRYVRLHSLIENEKYLALVSYSSSRTSRQATRREFAVLEGVTMSALYVVILGDVKVLRRLWHRSIRP